MRGAESRGPVKGPGPFVLPPWVPLSSGDGSLSRPPEDMGHSDRADKAPFSFTQREGERGGERGRGGRERGGGCQVKGSDGSVERRK